MLKHTFSPPSFRKKQYFKINLTTTDSTQNHQETWENSNISKLYNLLPVFVERKHSLHLEEFSETDIYSKTAFEKFLELRKKTLAIFKTSDSQKIVAHRKKALSAGDGSDKL